MSRRILVLGVVFACFALILWSGYQNHSVHPSASSLEQPSRYTSASAVSPTPQDDDEARSPLLGQTAPDFTLRDMAGHSVRLNSYRGKAVLINFWATWCAPCTVEMPWFVALRQQYAAQGFEVLGIDKDFPEDVAKVPDFASRMGLTYPVLYGDGRTYAEYHCCDYLPMSYYVDRSGTIRFVTVGLGTHDRVESNIRKMLGPASIQRPEQVIATTETTRPAK